MRSIFALIVWATCGAVAYASTSCEGLAGAAISGVAIKVAQAVPAGSFTPPGRASLSNLPPFCRVAGVISPTADSSIRFEVWMPGSDWNGKFQGIGNGGFGGSIGFAAMAAAVRRGYAAASTDTGHAGGTTDATWALGHPEKVVDFGYRAIHETAEKAKAIVGAFYGQGPRRSYFNSCSNGGRQALMEAQQFPADYDGIIAGAPANYWTHLLTASMWDVQATMGEAASYIPADKVPAIESATLAACDGQDGVKDGVIEDPSSCHFDPGALLCKGPESIACLAAPQVAALKKLYSGPLDSKGGQVFPGYSVGGESGSGGWPAWITGGGQGKALMYAFGTQFFSNMLYQNAAWDWRMFTVDRDMKSADEKLGPVMNATDADLKKFQARGGKLILYHGWSDAAIAPMNAIRYYESVISKMGAKNTEPFVRLYMVPGMQHCGGGPGPNNFGQASVPAGDAQHDMSAALERWVEEGIGPDTIIATGYKTGTNPASGVARTRPLCAYPAVAHWKGSGSTDDAANFECVKRAGEPSK